MSTVAQIEANIANSQLSTGPRTLEGKARSAPNATQLLIAAWNMERANRLEATPAAAEDLHPLLSKNKTYDRITRARSQAERTYHKCLRDLRAAKATRPTQSRLLFAERTQSEGNSISHGIINYISLIRVNGCESAAKDLSPRTGLQSLPPTKPQRLLQPPSLDDKMNREGLFE